MENILKKLLIIQEMPSQNTHPRLGKIYCDAQRINPYNPLSYIYLAIMFVTIIIAYGLIGVYDEFKNAKNPFKWR